MKNSLSRTYAKSLDQQDPLSKFRSRFLFPDPNLIYLDGNSLGRETIECAGRLQTLSLEWANELIRGYNRDWWHAPGRVGDKIGRLVGARAGQIVTCDTVSVNLYKLTIAALELNKGRKTIITDTLNFPSDLYILQGVVRTLGNKHTIHAIGSLDEEITPNLEELKDAIDGDTALVTFSHVTFKSGFLYDMKAITEMAHQQGAMVLWDLSHSVGAVPIALDECGVDFAIGCTYKYLNGGPGSPAFLYVNQSLQNDTSSPIWGWWGQKEPFAFDREYEPAAGITRFLSGSQPILSLLTMEAALEPILEAGMTALRQKSLRLGEYLIQLSDEYLIPEGFSLGSPRDANERGAHVSIRHPEGYRINLALIEEMNLIPDFRDPDNLRLGLAPLYTTYEDVYEGVQRIRRAVSEKLYAKYPSRRTTVT